MVNGPRLLFLCTANACRSRMAEGFARSLFGDRAEVMSAGTDPADRVHPLAVEVMAEHGIDIGAGRPISIDDLPDPDFDLVITVCDRARESCPVLPGARVIHWGFPDPAAFEGSLEERRSFFARVAGDIRAHVERLGAGLGLLNGAEEGS